MKVRSLCFFDHHKRTDTQRNNLFFPIDFSYSRRSFGLTIQHNLDLMFFWFGTCRHTATFQLFLHALCMRVKDNLMSRLTSITKNQCSFSFSIFFRINKNSQEETVVSRHTMKSRYNTNYNIQEWHKQQVSDSRAVRKGMVHLFEWLAVAFGWVFTADKMVVDGSGERFFLIAAIRWLIFVFHHWSQ